MFLITSLHTEIRITDCFGPIYNTSPITLLNLGITISQYSSNKRLSCFFFFFLIFVITTQITHSKVSVGVLPHECLMMTFIQSKLSVGQRCLISWMEL